METEQFDAISRTLGSRRHALGAALGGMTLLSASGIGSAKKRKKKKCKPTPGTCTCKPGEQCFPNGSCGLVCDEGRRPCPAGCMCTAGSSLDVFSTCFIDHHNDCANVPIVCGPTGDCPKGTLCIDLRCAEGPSGRCFPVCNA